MLAYARSLRDQGLCPLYIVPRGKLPPRGSRWKHLKTRLPTDAELVRMFGHANEGNIAVMCGKASGNLMVLDADTPELYTEILHSLSAKGKRTQIVQRAPNGTPHDGGGKFHFRTPVPVCTRKIDMMGIGKLDVLGQGKYSLYPPSMHPGGTPYEFIDDGPILMLDSLDLGFVQLEPYVEDDKPTTTRRAGVSVPNKALHVTYGPYVPDVFIPKKAKLLLEGDKTALRKYHTRSEAEMAICCCLYRFGFAYHDAFRLFSTHTYPGKFREKLEKNGRSAEQYLNLTWTKAASFIEKSIGEVELVARGLREWARDRQWPGNAGPYDRVVYIAHTAIMEYTGKVEYNADPRDTGLMCGLSHQAVLNANDRLEDIGLLRIKRSDDSYWIYSLIVRDTMRDHVNKELINGSMDHHGLDHAVDHVLTIDHDLDHSIDHDLLKKRNVIVRQGLTFTASLDAFRYSALDKSGAQIWDTYIRQGQMSDVEMAKRTGRSLATVKRKNRLMAECGLLEKLDNGAWTIAPDASLDKAATLLGTAGELDKQAANIEEQREDYEEKKKEWEEKWEADQAWMREHMHGFKKQRIEDDF